MERKKCQKCGGDNIVLTTLNPGCDDDFCEKYVECKDCGFSIKIKNQTEIDSNWEDV